MTIYHIWDDDTERKDHYRDMHFTVLDYDLTVCGRWIPRDDDTNIVCGLSAYRSTTRVSCEICILLNFEREANDG